MATSVIMMMATTVVLVVVMASATMVVMGGSRAFDMSATVARVAMASLVVAREWRKRNGSRANESTSGNGYRVIWVGVATIMTMAKVRGFITTVEVQVAVTVVAVVATGN